MMKHKNMSISTAVYSVVFSLAIVLLANLGAYFVVSMTTSATNPYGYMVSVVKERNAVSGVERSLEGFPILLFLFPIITALIIFAINRFKLKVNQKLTTVITILAFIAVLISVVLFACDYYENYGKNLTKVYLENGVFIP